MESRMILKKRSTLIIALFILARTILFTRTEFLFESAHPVISWSTMLATALGASVLTALVFAELYFQKGSAAFFFCLFALADPLFFQFQISPVQQLLSCMLFGCLFLLLKQIKFACIVLIVACCIASFLEPLSCFSFLPLLLTMYYSFYKECFLLEKRHSITAALFVVNSLVGVFLRRLIIESTSISTAIDAFSYKSFSQINGAISKQWIGLILSLLFDIIIGFYFFGRYLEKNKHTKSVAERNSAILFVLLGQIVCLIGFVLFKQSAAYRTLNQILWLNLSLLAAYETHGQNAFSKTTAAMLAHPVIPGVGVLLICATSGFLFLDGFSLGIYVFHNVTNYMG